MRFSEISCEFWEGTKVERFLLRSYHWLPFLSALCLASIAVAQVDPDEAPDGPSKRLSKQEQRQKFHPTAIKGMPASVWQDGYKTHLKLESESPFGGIAWRSVGPE